jgi:hypothetical protein
MAVIDEYRFGHIVIDGRAHRKDVIVLPTRVVSNWWRRDGHGLVLEDLDDVLSELPDRLIVGCGAHKRLRPDPRTIEELEHRGISVEALATEEAVRRFNELDPATTAAALHLTC